MKFDTESLSILGSEGQPIPNTFFRQQKTADHLAIVFPGGGYNCSMPLLYYCVEELLRRGVDTLQIEYRYDFSFSQLPEIDRSQRFCGDIQGVVDALPDLSSYSRLILIGKSLGTRALGYLTANPGPLKSCSDVRAFWLTPWVGDDHLFEQMKRCPHPSLYVVGTADAPCYLPVRLNELESARFWKSLILLGADHSLETSGVLPSLDNLRKVISAFQEFLNW